MVDRLTELMRAEADALDIPAPLIAAILQGGRRARRARYHVPALGVAAAAALVGAMVVIPNLNQSSNDPTAVMHERRGPSLTDTEAAAAAHAYSQSGAFAAGSKVYFGDFARGVEIDDPAVRGLYYTSAGVLVRHGKDYTMDGGGGGDNYSLVSTDGSVTGIDLSVGDGSPSTDPTQPYLAYGHATGESDWEVVILDLRTGEGVAVVPVDGEFTGGGSAAPPPVALSGDTVYVGLNDNTIAVDWRTGKTSMTGLPGSRFPDMHADRRLSVIFDLAKNTLPSADITVQDTLTGQVLLSLPDKNDSAASLSPDGKQLLVYPFPLINAQGDVGPMEGAVLYDIDTGVSAPVDPSPQGGYGWTPEGSVFSINHYRLTVCAIQGCSTTRIATDASDGGTIRLAGIVNDS